MDAVLLLPIVPLPDRLPTVALLPPKSKVPVLAIDTVALLGRAPAAAIRSVPLVIVVVPE